MNKTYMRPTMSAEQCETKAAFSLNYSSTSTHDAWTKQAGGTSSSPFNTDNIWDSQW